MSDLDNTAECRLLSPGDDIDSGRFAHETKRTKWRRQKHAPLFRQPLFWSTILLSLIASFGWLGLFISIRNQKIAFKHVDESVQPLWNKIIPDFPRVLRAFEYNTSFVTGPEVETAWADLIPPGNGFIQVNGGKELGLGKGVEVFGTEAYCVSAFHQIHCLSTIKNALSMPAALDMDDPSMNHIGHCLDYLRQQIVCSADTALEHKRADGGMTEVDGWGVTHQCRDWDAVWRWARDNRPKLTDQAQ